MLHLAVAALAFSPGLMLQPAAQRAAAPVMLENGRREALFFGLSAAAAASFPLAASAGPREDGIAQLRKRAAAAKAAGPREPVGLWNGPPKGSGADKCTVSKACTSGAGLKWDAEALGVKAAEKRKFFKTPTYANSEN